MEVGLSTFSAEASASLPGPAWLLDRRRAAFERWRAAPLPDAAADLWRYSGISDLDIERFAPRIGSSGSHKAEQAVEAARRFVGPLGSIAGLVVTLDGSIVHADLGAGWAASAAPESPDEDVVTRRDPFDDLHGAFSPAIVHLGAAKGVALRDPVVVVHLVDADSTPTGSPASASELVRSPAAFPHSRIAIPANADVQVVEIVTSLSAANGSLHHGPIGSAPPSSVPSSVPATVSPPAAIVFPLTEVDVADGGRLAHAVLQVLGPDVWQFGVQAARVGRDATYRAFTASLGGGRSRTRAEVVLDGVGAEAQLVAGYLGAGDQIHDLRTIHDHVAPKTHSQLLCKGAVAGHARSVYVGLTRIRKGARGADAFQTNHNLVLSEGSHADSIPNLDIEENDVRCSHASTVGPIDDEQRYYLESRGIVPELAERLIVEGFFTDLSSRSPIGVARSWFDAEVARRLADLADRDIAIEP